MPKHTIGLGADGVVDEITEAIEWTGAFTVRALVNDDESIKFDQIQKPPIEGTSENLTQVAANSAAHHFFVGICSIRSRAKRREFYSLGIKCGLKPNGASHPKATVSRSAQMRGGCCILAGAIIGPHAILYENVIVGTGAIVQSRCCVRAHAQLAAGCSVGSGVTIGECSYIGNGAFVLPNLRIGEDVVIEPGAIVTEDVPDGAVIFSSRLAQLEQMGRKLRPGRAAAEKAGAKMAVA